MGNLLETCIHKAEEEAKVEEVDGREENVEEWKKGRSNNRRVKIVLTKVELEWVMFQLKETEGVGLEEILKEIERSRGTGERSIVGWKPSLESITESPELQEMDNRNDL